MKEWTIYKASKVHHVPFNTLKRYLKISPGPNEVLYVKKGRPMVLTAEEEQQLVPYTTQMQDIGFGLTATDVRKQAYEIAARSGRQNMFQAKDGSAGWDWWVSFKKRNGLIMRTP